ncbi:RNA-directed DNA polymerase from mobile element jockey-like [Elysia marginata]|uniref:RNA-directed DNA polymerase from mobile element jockey-like n=1 Tax=Elysia marginata TaxID=1093978 RepID=A0AAV4I0E6_9GAST|nr:RNA-directed DNA polymerase from mobile element jockey-like [Elysia marginata]
MPNFLSSRLSYHHLLVAANIYIRYLQMSKVLDLLSGTRRDRAVNKLSLVLGWISAFGLTMVANFQVREQYIARLQGENGHGKAQIDYIMISKRFRNALLILAAKTYPSADCYSDHVPVTAKFKLKLKKTRKLPTNIKLDLAILKTNQSLREKYQISVQNKFEALKEVEKIEEQWENFKSVLTEAATEVIPSLERKAKQKWMTNEILEMMDERRKAKGNKEKYKLQHKKVQEECNRAKENWINNKCKDIDLHQKLDPKTMYKNIEEITRKKACSSTRCLKAKNGDIIIDKERILERWAEYIEELFNDNRKEYDVMERNFAGPPILKVEVRAAIRKMKSGKATGPDKISVELIEALEDYGIEKTTNLLNEIYDTGQIPTDLTKSIFIALPKKQEQLNVNYTEQSTL